MSEPTKEQMLGAYEMFQSLYKFVEQHGVEEMSECLAGVLSALLRAHDGGMDIAPQFVASFIRLCIDGPDEETLQ